MSYFKRKGFTLIELLVVIAALGLMASIIVATTSDARMKARDAKRKADLRQMATMMEMYYNQYGYYPAPSGGAGWCSLHGGSWCFPEEYCWTDLANKFKAAGILTGSKLPRDPIDNPTFGCGPAGQGSFGDGCGYSYIYIFDSDTKPQHYLLVAHLENTADPDRCQLKCWRTSTFTSEPPHVSICPGGSGYPNCTAPVDIYGSNYLWSPSSD